jgi:hypothetical protein
VTRLESVRAERGQRLTLIYAVMTCLALLIAIQFVLLMVAVEGFLGHESELLWPTTLGSGACFAAACWLIRHIVVPFSITKR